MSFNRLFIGAVVGLVEDTDGQPGLADVVNERKAGEASADGDDVVVGFLRGRHGCVPRLIAIRAGRRDGRCDDRLRCRRCAPAAGSRDLSEYTC